MKDYSEDIPPKKVEAAKREGMLYWEKIGVKGVKGELPGFNAATWIFTMKNKAGWRNEPEASQVDVDPDLSFL